MSKPSQPQALTFGQFEIFTFENIMINVSASKYFRSMILMSKHTFFEVISCTGHIFNFVSQAVIVKSKMAAMEPLFFIILCI